MKVVCEREMLHEAFQNALVVVPTRSPVPMLSNLKLSARSTKEGDVVEISCTDMDIGLRYTIPAKGLEAEGEVVVNAHRIAGIARETGKEEISIQTDGYLAHIQTSDSQYKVVGVDPADFPILPQFDEASSIPVSSKDLSEMIRKTGFAASTEQIKYALAGQLLEICAGREIRLVASDGKRMAFIRRKTPSKQIPEGAKKEMRVLVPPRALNLLTRILTENDEVVYLNVEETQIKLKTSRAMIFARLVEGNFPDYDNAIPKDSTKTAIIQTEPFYSAIRRAMLLTTEKARAVELTFLSDRLILFTRTQEIGEAKVELPIEYKGKEFEIVFNPEFLLDYLRVVDEQQLELHMKDKNTAGLFKAGRDYLYVLMPLSIQF
jgi:DNA polymerase-3 subunit beta